MLNYLASVLLVIWLCRAASAQASIKIGVSLGFSGFDSQMAFDVLNATNLRLKQIMEEPEIHSDLKVVDPASPPIQLVMNDNWDPDPNIRIPTASTSIKAANYLALNEKVTAMIGTSYSDATKGFAAAASYFDIPVCDGASTDPALGSRSDFPTFFSSIPQDTIGVQATMEILLHYGWKRIGLVGSTSGSNLLAKTKEYAEAMNVTIVTLQTFYPDTDDFSLIVQKLRESQATIFVYFGTPDGMIGILDEAEKQGMTSANYQWLVQSDVFYHIYGQDPAHPDAGGLSLEQLRRWQGVWVNYPREATGQFYEHTYLPAWQQEYRDGNTSSVPSTYSMFFVTCIEMLVYGFDNLLKTNKATFTDLADIQASAIMLSVPNDFSFPTKQGVTGNLSLNALGERVGGIEFYFYDALKDHWTAFLEWDEAADSINRFRPTGDGSVSFFGGGSTAPSDTLQITMRQTIVDFQSGMGIFTIALFAIAILAVVSVAAVLVTQWNNPILKAASPPFLLTTLLGILTGVFYPLTLLGTPSKATCVAAAWLIPCSLGLVLGSLLVKTFRLFVIFKKQGATRIGTKNKHMFLWLFAVFGTYVIVVLVWCIVDPPYPREETYNVISPTLVESQAFCAASTDSRQFAVLSVLIAQTAILLGVGGFMAFVTRRLPKQFSESKQLGAILYAYVAIMIFVLPILFLLEINYAGYLIIKVLATYAAVFLTLLILYGSKMYQLWQLYKANKSDDNIVKGGLRKKKDELTDSWAVHSVSKTATKYGKVWVSDRQSFVSFWAERTLVLYADKAIALLTGGGGKKDAATTCRYFPLTQYEILTNIDENEGVYTIRLKHPTDARFSVTLRVPNQTELDEWAGYLVKLGRRTTSLAGLSKRSTSGAMSLSTNGTTRGISDASSNALPRTLGSFEPSATGKAERPAETIAEEDEIIDAREFRPENSV